MILVLGAWAFVRALLGNSAAVSLENIVLRHQLWNVRAARNAAWTNAQVLWGLGGFPPLRGRFFSKLELGVFCRKPGAARAGSSIEPLAR